MTRVKICGVTRPEDARLAVQLGAFAVGMIFWPGSPRCIDADIARTIVDVLPNDVEAVGVFVDQSAADVLEIARAAGLSAVQLHGEEDVENVDDYQVEGCMVMKAVALGDASDVERATALPASILPVLDAYDPVRRGGTGRPIDWALAARVGANRPVVLSGGLHAGNVVEAVRIVRPYAIDVSSGVEQAPGRKDPAKLRALFAAVREL